MGKRTHIDHLLERGGITKKLHAKLKAEEIANRQAADDAARKVAETAIHKARMVDCGECPRVSTGCESGRCLRS